MMNAGNLKEKTRQISDWRRRLLAFVLTLSLLISSCGLTAFAESDDDVYSAPVTAPIPAESSTSPEPDEASVTPAPEGEPETGTESEEGTPEGTEPEEGTNPEEGTEPEEGTNPEEGTEPEEGTQDGTEEGSEEGTEPEEGTKPEEGTEPEEGTPEGTEPEEGTNPEEGIEPEDMTVYEPGTLTAEAEDVEVTIDYTAEARVPEGTVLSLNRAAGSELYSALKSAAKVLKTEANETWQREVGDEAVFYNLSLTSPEGVEVRPQTGVSLTFRNLTIPAGATGFVTGSYAENIDWEDTLTVDFLPDAIGYAYLKQVQIGTVTLIHEGLDYTVTASYGPEAGFPYGTDLKVREVMPGTPEYALYSGMTEEAMSEEWTEVTLERYFDITFVLGETELEPQGDVDVQITFKEAIEQTEEVEVQAVHIENNEANIIESNTDSTEVAQDNDEAIDTVSFTSDSFSVFGVVQKKKIVTKVLDAQGNTYEIDVTYTQEAEIPEDAQVKVEEIPEGSDLWEAYRKQTAAALDADDVVMPGLYDISIIDAEGNKVEPRVPVSVAIKLLNDENTTEDIQVVHFTEEIPQELVEAVSQPEEQASGGTEEQTEVQPEPLAEEDKIASETITAKVEDDIVAFDTRGFSVYAFAYTVDFHYEDEEGNKLEWSYPGRGSYPVADILTAIGGEGEITNVTLKLIEGELVDGALYLTQDEAGIWFLNSDVAFSDTYELTIITKKGTYVLKITDAQIGTITVNDAARGHLTYKRYQSNNDYTVLKMGDPLENENGYIKRGITAVAHEGYGFSHWVCGNSYNSWPSINYKNYIIDGGTMSVDSLDNQYFVAYFFPVYKFTVKVNDYSKDKGKFSSKYLDPNWQKKTTTAAPDSNYVMTVYGKPSDIYGSGTVSEFPVNPVPYDGYQFAMWVYSQDGKYKAAYNIDESTLIPYDNVVYEANFAPKGEFMILGFSEDNNKGTVEGLYAYSDGYQTLKAVPNSGYAFDGWYDSDGNFICPYDVFDPEMAGKSMVVYARFRNAGQIWYNTSVNNSDYGYLLNSNNEAYWGRTYANDDGSIRYRIRAYAYEGYVFSHWTLNGMVLSNTSNELYNNPIVYLKDNDNIQAVFVPSTIVDDSGVTPGIEIDENKKNELKQWMQSLSNDLAVQGADKSAHVVDNKNRIYQVNLKGQSSVMDLTANIDLAFLLDMSGSMRFPSKLVSTGKTVALTQNELNNAFPDDNTPYYIISDPSGTSTVYRIYRDGNGDWCWTDASYNDHNVIDGSERYAEKSGSPTYSFQIYYDGEPGKLRQHYLNQSLTGALDSARKVLAMARKSDETADIRVAYNHFASSVVYSHPEFTSISTGINVNITSTTGGTRQDLALHNSLSFEWDTIDGQPNTNEKYAILITDGAPVVSSGSTLTVQQVYNNIQTEANALKAKGVKLITVGLSTKNVKGGSAILSKIADTIGGVKQFYEANSGDELEAILLQIIQAIMAEAHIGGTVTDTVDEVFYPVHSDGTYVTPGNYDMNGNAISNISGYTDPYYTWSENGGKWTITWHNQVFGWENDDTDWQGTFLIKAKENFLGGLAMPTNDSDATIQPERIIYSDGSELTLTDAEEITLETPYVNVKQLAFTQDDTTITVPLGTIVDPLNGEEAIKYLFNQIKVKKLVSSNDGSNRNTGTMLGDVYSEDNTVSLVSIVADRIVNGTDEEQLARWAKMLFGPTDNNTLQIRYPYGDHYRVGNILMTLAKEYSDEDANKVTGHYNSDSDYSITSEHKTNVVGTPVETYILTVTYDILNEDERQETQGTTLGSGINWHTTPGEGPGNNPSDIVSENNHIINVDSYVIEAEKIWPENYDASADEVVFRLYASSEAPDLSNVTGNNTNDDDDDDDEEEIIVTRSSYIVPVSVTTWNGDEPDSGWIRARFVPDDESLDEVLVELSPEDWSAEATLYADASYAVSFTTDGEYVTEVDPGESKVTNITEAEGGHPDIELSATAPSSGETDATLVFTVDEAVTANNNAFVIELYADYNPEAVEEYNKFTNQTNFNPQLRVAQDSSNRTITISGLEIGKDYGLKVSAPSGTRLLVGSNELEKISIYNGSNTFFIINPSSANTTIRVVASNSGKIRKDSTTKGSTWLLDMLIPSAHADEIQNYVPKSTTKLVLPSDAVQYGTDIHLNGQIDQNGEYDEWKAKWTNLPMTDGNGDPIYYYVEEISSTTPTTATYIYTFDQQSGTKLISLKINNTPREPGVGGLTVKKVVTGNAGSTEKKFFFTVTLDDDSINGEKGEMTFENGVATFELMDKQSITATELPEGVHYTVVENDYTADGYTTNVTEGNAEGEIEESKTKKVTFTNNRTVENGGIKLKKLVVATDNVEEEQQKEFTFTIEILNEDNSVNEAFAGPYGDLTFTEGKAIKDLKHNESVTISGLPYGTLYKISETYTDPYEQTTLYAESVRVNNGEVRNMPLIDRITSDSIIDVVVTNTKTETINIVAQKGFTYGSVEPTAVQFTLKRKGGDEDGFHDIDVVTITAADEWKHEWTNLDKTYENWTGGVDFTYFVVETGLYFGELVDPIPADKWVAANISRASDGNLAYDATDNAYKITITNTSYTDVLVVKEWPDFSDAKYNWYARFRLLKKEVLVAGNESTDDAALNWTIVNDSNNQPITVTATKAENAPSFSHLDVYSKHSNGNVYQVLYKVEEYEYKVWENSDENNPIAQWSEDNSLSTVTYNNNDYIPVFTNEIAGENVAITRLDERYTIVVNNMPQQNYNGKLVVKKEWLGILKEDLADFPEVYFTLYYLDPSNYEINAEQAHVYDSTYVDYPLNYGNNWTVAIGNLPSQYRYFVVETANEHQDGESRRYDNGIYVGRHIKVDAAHTFNTELYYYNIDGYQAKDSHSGAWKESDPYNHIDVFKYDEPHKYAVTNEGEIVIRNRCPAEYMQMDLKKKFLEYRTDENGVVSLWTTTSEDDVMRNMYIKLQMYRRIVRDDTEPGSANPNVVVPWDTYGYPFLVGYDKNGQEDIRKDARNPFDVEDAEGTWAYRIPNVGQNQGLPRRGLYKDSNGNYIQVRYQYLFKEIDVLDGDFNSIGGEWAAWLPYLWEAKDKHANKEVQVFELQTAQDQDRILNVPGASLTIQKDWVGGHSDIEEIYIKVYRRTEESSGGWTDFTDVICKEMNLGAISQNYVEGASTSLDTTNKWLVLKQSNNWKVTIHHVPILNSKDSGRRFEYKIVEVGYKDINHPNKIYTEEETGAAFSPTYYEWSISANDFVEQTTGQGFILKYKHDLYNKLMVRNSRPYGSLQIIKRVMPLGKESEADNVDFVFDVTLNLPAEKTLASSDLSIAEEYGTISDFSRTDQTVTFKVTIKGANTVTIDGIPYGTTYTVVEETLPSGWAKVGSEEYSDASTKTVSATDDPIDWVRATNTEITEVKVDKTWFQTDGTKITGSIQNATVTVKLEDSLDQPVTDVNGKALEDEVLIKTLNGSESPAWTHVWQNLPKYYAGGTEIQYSVVETAATINGENLTPTDAKVDSENARFFHLENTLPETCVKAKKNWADGKTPPANTLVELTLSATVPGTEPGSASVAHTITGQTTVVTLNGTEEPAWTHEWTELPKYDENGKLITYIVKETAYTIGGAEQGTVNADDPATDNTYNFTFTNPIPVTERHALKIWDDNENAKGVRPASIIFKLSATAGGQPVDLSEYTFTGALEQEVVTTGADGNKADWTGLPVYTKAGVVITYTCEEIAVPKYTQSGEPSYNVGTYMWTFTNKLNEIKLDIIKDDGNSKELSGAVFELRRKNDSGNYVAVTDGSVENVGKDGRFTVDKKITLTGITDGDYQIAEISAPAGYIGFNGTIQFTVANGDIVEPSSADGVDGTVIRYTKKTEGTNAEFKVANTAGAELPSTGGSGTLIYTITGIFLIALAGVILVSRKKRKV